MKDHDKLRAASNKTEKHTGTEPAEAGRAIAHLLHGSPEAPKPEVTKTVEAPAPTERKKRFDLSRMIAKVTGEAAPANKPSARPEALQKKAEKLADDSETVKANAEEELAEVSELELDRHIEARDQAIPKPKPHVQSTSQPITDDDDDENGDSPTSISTIIANRSFDQPASPQPAQTSHLPAEPLDDITLYATYVKYGFIAAIVIILFVGLMQFL